MGTWELNGDIDVPKLKDVFAMDCPVKDEFILDFVCGLKKAAENRVRKLLCSGKSILEKFGLLDLPYPIPEFDVINPTIWSKEWNWGPYSIEQLLGLELDMNAGGEFESNEEGYNLDGLTSDIEGGAEEESLSAANEAIADSSEEAYHDSTSREDSSDDSTEESKDSIEESDDREEDSDEVSVSRDG